jgi:hypothetical protein
MMRIRFDVVTPEHRYPLPRKEALHALSCAYEVEPGLRDAIRSVRFGCNRTTAQEGRITSRGPRFDVRVNFCLEDGRSRQISTRPNWTRPVLACGGVLEPETGYVTWSEPAARQYAAFILFHELAHVLYLRRSGASALEGKGGSDEERFCDDWAVRMLGRWTRSGEVGMRSESA